MVKNPPVFTLPRTPHTPHAVLADGGCPPVATNALLADYWRTTGGWRKRFP